MASSVLSVTQLNRWIKLSLEAEPKLRSLMVSGEISNCSARSLNGHLYFSLKDADSVIRCVMFASRTRSLQFVPENGMRVVVTGEISVYEKGGQYQINVFDMLPDGVGALYLQFEKTKARLQEMGLFDPAHKKPIPPMPRRIAVVTAPGGAALQDILQITARRWPFCEIVLCPVLVQGAEAPASLVAALTSLEIAASQIDLVIIGRGGGSMEDLWAFNSEALAYAIYRCSIPIISAVGHEVDFTIADFVADLRAPTPSAAAELAVPDRASLLAGLRVLQKRLDTAYQRQLQAKRVRWKSYTQRACFASPAAGLKLRRERLTRAGERLQRSMENRMALYRKLQTERKKRLELLDPLGVLRRGYAVAIKDDHAVTDAAQLQPGDSLHLLLANGSVEVTVQGGNPQ